jgi:hypothetical protein
VTNTDDKNRTVRPRNVSKDALSTPTKSTRRREDSRQSTIRTVSRSIRTPDRSTQTPDRSIKSPEKRDKRTSTIQKSPEKSPQKAPEKSTLGRRFASTVMQPAFEQVAPSKTLADNSYISILKSHPRKSKPSSVLKKLGEIWINLILMSRCNSSSPPSLLSHGTPTRRQPLQAYVNDSDPEMAEYFLKDVLYTGVEKEKIRDSYRQKSPLAELLYSRWIEGLRERWPAI